jgi:hypothetical protein
MIIANVHKFYKEPVGVAAANIAMESEPLLNKEWGLYTSVLYSTVFGQEVIRVSSLNTGIVASTR